MTEGTQTLTLLGPCEHANGLGSCQEKGVLVISYIGTDEQLAHIFTKPLRRPRFEKFRDLIGVAMPVKQKCNLSFLYHALKPICSANAVMSKQNRDSNRTELEVDHTC